MTANDKTASKLNATVLADEDIVIPKSRAEFDKITEAMKNRNQRKSPQSLSVGRENRLLAEAYLEKKDGAEAGIYRPKHEFV